MQWVLAKRGAKLRWAQREEWREEVASQRGLHFFSRTVCFAVKLSECKPVKIQQREDSWTVQRYCKRKQGSRKRGRGKKMKSQPERKKNCKVGWEKVKHVECQVKGFPPTTHPPPPQLPDSSKRKTIERI
jgi:hypothetical protein